MTILVKYEDGGSLTAEVRSDMTPLEIMSNEYLIREGKVIGWERVAEPYPDLNLVEAEKVAEMDDFVIQGYVTVSSVRNVSYSIEDSKRIMELAMLLDIGFFDAAERLNIEPQYEREVDYECEEQLKPYFDKASE